MFSLLMSVGAPDPALAAAIAATAPYEVPGRPCLARAEPRLQLSPAERRRQREVQSDSHWLNRLVRQRYGERLAFSGLTAAGGRLRHVIWLTGTARVPPLRLRDRAAGVPVEIRYGAPWSEAEVLRRREAAGRARSRLVPDTQGEGHHIGPDAGWVSLYVYSPDGQPGADVLAQCEALRAAYRLPVLIRFVPGRVGLR